MVIFLDDNGKKYYKLEPFTSPIYIKEKSFDECNMLENESEMDYVVYADAYTRTKILKDINNNATIKKKSVIN